MRSGIGKLPDGVAVGVVAAGERHALYRPSRPGSRAVLDEHGHVVHEPPERSGMLSSASATSSSNRSGRPRPWRPTYRRPVTSRPTARLAAGRCHTAAVDVAACSTGSTPTSARPSDRRRAARHPGAGRLGQDAGPHPPHRPPGRRRLGRRRPRARHHLHPPGRGRAAAPARPRSGCATGRRPARSTAWPGRCWPSAGPTSGRPRPELLADRHRLLGPAARRAARGRGRSAGSRALDDVVAEIDWARARLVTADALRRAPARRRGGRRSAAGDRWPS